MGKQTGGRSPSLGVLFLTVAIDLIGFGMVIPLLPLYAEQFGAGPAEIAWLSASYSAMQFLFAPVWGRLSDAIGRRPVLLTSIFINCLALAWYALADSFPLLLVARILSGICTASLSVASAYVTDITSPESRARGLGLLGAAFGVGFVIGPFLGGELSAFGTAAPPLAAAALSFANGVWAYFRLPESLPKEARALRGSSTSSLKARFALFRRARALHGMFGLGFIQVFSFAMLETMLVLFVSERLSFNQRDCGRLLAFAGVTMAIIQGGLLARLVRWFGEVQLVRYGQWLVAFGMACVPLTQAGYWPWLLFALFWVSVGQGLAGPSLGGLLSHRAAENERGLILGLNQSLSTLARALAPVLAGQSYALLGASTPFWWGSALAAIGAVWTVQIFATLPRHMSNTPP